MKFHATKSGLAIWALFLSYLVSGCSTFLNPFKNDQPEDYNILTYGEEYRGKSPTATWTPQRITAGGEPDTSNKERMQYDSVAKSTYDPESMDPTDDRVRAELEVGRGQAVYAYARGDRATRADFQDNKPNDGSLWSNDVDGNYFFTKGKVRGLGDIISVKAEDPFIKHVAEEIKKNLSPAEQEVEMALYLKNSSLAKDDKDVSAYRAVASDDLKSKDAVEVKEKMQKAVRWSQVDLSSSIGVTPNEEIRAEIVDRYPNGNYKIRAVKRVLYRGSSKLVSVVGVAPANDFDDKDTIASSKLYEYKIRVAR